jgi:hypothetical protein
MRDLAATTAEQMAHADHQPLIFRFSLSKANLKSITQSWFYNTTHPYIDLTDRQKCVFDNDFGQCIKHDACTKREDDSIFFLTFTILTIIGIYID